MCIVQTFVLHVFLSECILDEQYLLVKMETMFAVVGVIIVL